MLNISFILRTSTFLDHLTIVTHTKTLHKTMEMMYEMVYNALEEVGIENTYTPEDYLNFFCLGNREALDERDIENSPLDNSIPQFSGNRTLKRFVSSANSCSSCQVTHGNMPRSKEPQEDCDSLLLGLS
ncbi:hypothetical protein Scep_023085 [Stephania cephalantha]|uniref:Uncharacterized protein n=1 Tax=Stephania cephalantha TaxID=152367 RepID=A0AAP0F7M6_9MAGN